MGERILKKLDYIVGLLPIGALFGLAAFVANIEIKDLDLWLHIGVGKFITEHHYIPTVDMLSATIAGRSWVNHEWLFQILVYNIFNHWGADGLLTMQVSIVLLTMVLLLFLGYSKEKQITTAFTLCLVFLVYQQRFTIRPDLYSLLFFTMYIFVLALHIDKKWAPAVLFAVQVLWSNMHGFFFFGPLFVLIGLISEWIKRHIKLPFEWNESGCLTDEEYKRIKKILIYVLLACLINPQGITGALYPIGVFFSLSGESQIFFKYIQELQKPVSMQTIFQTGPNVYYKLLMFLSFISFVYNRRRIDISALFFWIIFLVFSLKAVRNLPFFAFAAYLVIITNMFNVSYDKIIPIRFTHEKFKYITLIVLKLFLLVWIVNYMNVVSKRSYYDFEKYDRKSEFGGISLTSYPHKAVEFMKENGIKGKIFNDFNSGAYFVGKMFPDIKVFIDGRTEVYGAKFFKDYQKIWDEGDQRLFDEAVEKYGLTVAFLNSTRQYIKKPLLDLLLKKPEWKLVYFDYDALIFLKDIEENKPLIEKYGIKLSEWEPQEVDLLKLGPANVLPYQQYFRAYTLEAADIDETALRELRQALIMVPDYSPAYQLMGKIYAKKKDYDKAFRSFRAASLLAPYDKDNRFNLAMAYLDLGEYHYALKQYNTTIQYWPSDPKGFFFTAKTYAMMKDYRNLLPAIRRAHGMDRHDAVDVLQIADIVYDQKEYGFAKEIYLIVLAADQKNVDALKKLGAISQEQNQLPEALGYYKRAHEISPQDDELKGKVENITGLISVK